MFALESENKLEIVENEKLNTKNVIDKILLIYKKLKKIAKYEINSRDNFLNQKIQILTQINQLLNDYSKLVPQNENKNNSSDDFSKFFE